MCINRHFTKISDSTQVATMPSICLSFHLTHLSVVIVTVVACTVAYRGKIKLQLWPALTPPTMSSVTSPSGTGSTSVSVDQSQVSTTIFGTNTVQVTHLDDTSMALVTVPSGIVASTSISIIRSQVTSSVQLQPTSSSTSTFSSFVSSFSTNSNPDSNTIITPTTTFSSSISSSSDSDSHIGAIIGGAVGGLIALNIAIIALVLIYRLKRRSKQQFVEAFDLNGNFEPNRPSRKSTRDEISTRAGEHLAVTEMSAGAQPRGVTSYPFSSSTPAPPVMTALDGGAADIHGETSAEGEFGGRSTRNVFIHQDGGRIELASQDRLEEGEQEEIPPTYESLIRSIRSGGFWSRRSEIGSRVSSGRGASRNENETGRSGPGK
ncbi:uncharacterized protein C8R40DRAFT_848008 [Lentinula edodes]|uniref:uncharacterized protein n=1 Tax=Lentinula edodes TaxID=5353 RepID=UPI001E8E5E0A|nr:uncharacterized protein C8R40DRAFT_848008 [Lentinula edodes]KAH7868273.1 hypothetical protein C8R40DRAFT_848008 [Lentinula edodes]